jgi:hypothetical protein
MSTQFSLGKSLRRAAVYLGLFGCLIVAQTVSSQAATSESSVVASQAVMGADGATSDFCGSRCAISDNCDLVLTVQMEIGLPDEFGVAFEDDDSIEMLRVDIEQRLFGIDHEVIGPGIASHPERNIRSSISSPLLV